MAVYQRFVAELDQSGQHLTQQVSEIDLSDPEDLRAMMPEQGSDILAHFGEDQFMHRLEIYKAHIAEWRGRYPKLIGVDLRYNGEVPLEMSTNTAGSGSSATATISAPGETEAKESKPETMKSEAGVMAKPATKPSSVSGSPGAAEKPKTARTPAKLTPAQKAADAKRKAAKLKAEKLRAARAAHLKAEKAAIHKPVHTSPAQVKQGQ
jgi:cell division protein FtsQ